VRVNGTHLLSTRFQLHNLVLLLLQIPLSNVDLSLQLGALLRQHLLLLLQPLHLPSLGQLLVPPLLNVRHLVQHDLDLSSHPRLARDALLHLAFGFLDDGDSLGLARLKLSPIPCDDELGESFELRGLLLEFKEDALLLAQFVELGSDLISEELVD
jgi:hypothetical protein